VAGLSCAALLLGILVSRGAGQTLGGSSRSLEIHFAQARAHDFTFLATPAQVERFVKAGYLVRVRRAASLQPQGVSYSYARPQMRLFLQRLSGQCRRACG
jgi:hypothetical protein